MATLKYLSQYFSTTLNVGGGIDASQTTGIILQSVSGVHDITEPGQICVTYSDPIDTSVAEWIDYTSINGSNELVGAVRGREGFSAHTHLQNATVAFILSASHHNDIVDQLNGTETGTTLKAPVITGQISGEALTGGYPITNSSMSRQAIINGNFDVWQRGTSFNATSAGGVYTADRWHYGNSSSSAWTVSRQDGTGANGSRYCIRVARNSGVTATPTQYLRYYMESADSILFRGKKLALSFMARKGANYSGSGDGLTAYIRSGTGTDEKMDFTGQANAGGTTATLTTSWQKFTVTTDDVLAGTVNQIGLDFEYTTTGTAGAADYFEITQVQLCAGDVALPFQPKSFAQELLDCMRYYEKSYGYLIVPGTATAGGSSYGKSVFGTSSIVPYDGGKFKVEKRDIPTMILYNNSDGTANQVRNEANGATVSGDFTFGSSTTAIGIIGKASAFSATDTYSFQWTASAEL